MKRSEIIKEHPSVPRTPEKVSGKGRDKAIRTKAKQSVRTHDAVWFDSINEGQGLGYG